MGISRRDFLGRAITGIAAIWLPARAITSVITPIDGTVTEIKDSPMYKAIGRKLLMVSELPQGALARYERDISVQSYVVPRRVNG